MGTLYRRILNDSHDLNQKLLEFKHNLSIVNLLSQQTKKTLNFFNFFHIIF